MPRRRQKGVTIVARKGGYIGGSTIIKLSPLSGSVGGSASYVERNFVAAAPRSGGAKLSLNGRFKLISKAGPMLAEGMELPRKRAGPRLAERMEPPRKENEAKSKESVRVEVIPSLEEMSGLKDLMQQLLEDREKSWFSERKKNAITERYHSVKKRYDKISNKINNL